jgi:hypothetical protein
MVPGSIPGGVTGFFVDIFPSDRTMALGLTQPLVKLVPGTFLGVKAAGAWGWRPRHLRVPNVMKSGNLEPSGPHRACYGTVLPLLPVPKVLVCWWQWVMSMEDRWNDMARETRVHGKKPVSLPLCHGHHMNWSGIKHSLLPRQADG